nr:hypothetical protein [Mammaliicoccus sp. Marseille-Q6498]
MLYGKDFVNTHSKEFGEVLQTEVSKLLKPSEMIFSFAFSNNKNSYYITLLNTDLHQWITFRISDHKRKGSLKSLYTVYYDHYQDVESMMKIIEEYLEKTSWCTFSYKHYFILKTIKDMSKYKGKILLKIPKGDYKHISHKVTFEQEVNEGKILVSMKDIEEKTNNIMRSLYVQDMLTSEIYRHTRKSPVYVPSLGIKMLDHFHSLYYKQYEDDFSEEIYQDFKVPDSVEQIVETDNKIILKMEDIKAFNQYYVYGLVNNENKELIHIGYHLGNLNVEDLEEIPVIKDYKHNEKILINNTLISPVIFMTDISEQEAQIATKALINQYRILNPANFGDVVSFNQMYNYANDYQTKNSEISSKIYGNQNMIQHHIQTQYINIEKLGKQNILIVKLAIDTTGNSVPAMRAYSTTSKVVKKALVSHIETSEQIAKKVKYIIGIHPHDGRVIAAFKVKDHKKRYTKFENETGKYKYTFNFYAYTEKISSINNINLIKTADTVLTNYRFVDQNGKMKKSKRTTVFVGNER